MEYTITNVNRRGEWNYEGSTMVDWAISLEGQQGWIKLTQKLETAPPEIGQTITGQIEDKVDRNGNPYKKFKKINPNFGGNRSGGADVSRIEQRLEYAIGILEQLAGYDEVHQQGATSSPEGELLMDDPFPDL